jgi:hypothetical protein
MLVSLFFYLTGTHVAIQSPGGVNSELYRNRKGYFSINVQAVTSATLMFENVVSRWMGSGNSLTLLIYCDMASYKWII